MLTKHKLGDLVEVTRGMSLPGEYYSETGEYIRLTMGNFNYNGGGFKENTSKTDIYYVGPVRDEYVLNKGDIITPLTEQAIGLLGTTAMIPESGKYIQSQDVALIKCKEDKIDHLFCYYLVSSDIVKKQLSAAAQQTKIRHTSPDKIMGCTVWIPEKSLQQKIGKTLYEIDQKIALNIRMNAELEAMAKQLYDYWFVQFDFPDENGNPYKSSGGKMVYNPTLKREIPVGWDSCKLGDFCNLYQPKTIGIDEMNINGKYHVYGANGLIGFYDKYNHEESEIVMACRGNSCGVINRTMPFSWITGNAMVLSVKDKSISNEFISQCTNYMNIKGAITGSGQPQLTRENLAPLLMILPSKDILTLFTRKIDFIVREQLHIKTEIEHLTHLRDSLLPMLMNGQVTVEK